MFTVSWFYGPTSVDHFHHLLPGEGELALLQVYPEVKHLRDTVGKRASFNLNGLRPTFQS